MTRAKSRYPEEGLVLEGRGAIPHQKQGKKNRWAKMSTHFEMKERAREVARVQRTCSSQERPSQGHLQKGR